MQGPCQAVDASDERQVRICERTSDEVCGVGGDVASLVVGVEHKVEACDVFETLTVSDTHHVRIVACPVQRFVTWDVLAVKEDIPENARGEGWHLCYNVDAILEGVLPQLCLVDALAILLGKLTFFAEAP